MSREGDLPAIPDTWNGSAQQCSIMWSDLSSHVQQLEHWCTSCSTTAGSLEPHPHLACSQRPLRFTKCTILVIYLIMFFVYLFFCLHSGMHHSAAV